MPENRRPSPEPKSCHTDSEAPRFHPGRPTPAKRGELHGPTPEWRPLLPVLIFKERFSPRREGGRHLPSHHTRTLRRANQLYLSTVLARVSGPVPNHAICGERDAEQKTEERFFAPLRMTRDKSSDGFDVGYQPIWRMRSRISAL